MNHPPNSRILSFQQPAQVFTKHWGLADYVKQVANGITFFSTPSHGGYELSHARMEEMRQINPALVLCSYTKDNAFEHDAAWCAVALAWPKLFTLKEVDAAVQTFNHLYAHRTGFEGAIVDGRFTLTAKEAADA